MADIVLPSAQTTHFEANVNQGVIGGVRPDGAAVNVASYGTLQEGAGGSASVNTTAFNAARDASTSGQDIVWPAGIYNISSLYVASNVNNRKIRGAANYGTELRPTGNTGITGGVGANFNDGSATVTAGFTKGTTVFTVTGVTGSAFIVGRLLRVVFPDETTTPVVNTFGYSGNRRAIVRCTAWNSGTGALTFFPPLDFDVINTTGITVNQSEYGAHTAFTVQDLHINGVSSGGLLAAGVNFGSCDQCAYVRVKVTNFTNKGLWFSGDTLCAEIRECYVDATTSGPNKSGFQFDTASHALVLHNIGIGTFPVIQMNSGCSGCIVKYNYFPGITQVNHNPHNSLNLYEGNVTSFFWDDGYYGGASFQVFFRNWCQNKNNGVFKRFTRSPTMIGNVTGVPGATYSGLGYDEWGEPNLSNSGYSGTAQYSLADYWNDWDSANSRVKRWAVTLTTRTSDTVGTFSLPSGTTADFNATRNASFDQRLLIRWNNGAQPITVACAVASGDSFTSTASSLNLQAEGITGVLYAGPSGFQEKDQDVLASADLRANYHVYGAAIPAGQELGVGETLPDTLDLAGRPSLFGSLAFPPFDPFAPGTPAIEDIPAGFYYTNGYWPTDTPTAPTITTDPLTQTATEGDDVTLSANATGSPTPTWQWKKNGSNISGATTRFLALLDVTEADEASYTAVATNSEGTDTSAAGVLTVNPPVADTTPPTPNPSTVASVTVNSSSQITVVADAAVDAVSSPVAYNHSIGGVFAGWQSSATKIFSGLNASTLYAFRVKARDAALNETTQSAESSATTSASGSSAPNPLGNRGTRARLRAFFR